MIRSRTLFLLATFVMLSSGAFAGDGQLIFEDGFESGGTTAWEHELTIENYLSWCSVIVDNAPPSTAGEIILNFPPGTVVQLHADPVPPFVWGYWIGTDGGNPDASQTTTATMTSDRLIQACCPIAGDDCGPFP